VTWVYNLRSQSFSHIPSPEHLHTNICTQTFAHNPLTNLCSQSSHKPLFTIICSISCSQIIVFICRFLTEFSIPHSFPVFDNMSIASYTGVSRVFRRCFAGVSRVFRRCFAGVSQVFRGCFVGVSQVFRRCFAGVSQVFHGYSFGHKNHSLRP